MSKQLIKQDNHAEKIKKLLTIVAFASLFWLGYQYIRALNQVRPETPPVREPQVVASQKRQYHAEDPLLEIKLARDRERSREMEQIQILLDKLNLSGETRRLAEQELWRLTQSNAKENELESLLKANGFKNTLVTISPKLVTVIISNKILPEQVKLIGQMAAEVSSYRLDQIQIVKREDRND